MEGGGRVLLTAILRTNRIGRTYFNDLRQVILFQTWRTLRDLAESTE